MKPELILHADILDIIFEDRNKEYGAYILRRDYEARMKKAMLIVLGMVSIIFALDSFNFSSAGENKILDAVAPDIVLKSVDILEPDIPKPAELPKVKAASIPYATPVIVHQEIVDPIPELKVLAADILIGIEKSEGPPAISAQLPENGKDKNALNNFPVEPPEERNHIFERVEIMPEFPGGQAAFNRFLSKNLRVPEDALEPGEKIKLLVRFIVGKQGELTNIEFLESHGEVFEQEIIRVMKKMPKWKPGQQNGENVAVYFKLPILFDSPEE